MSMRIKMCVLPVTHWHPTDIVFLQVCIWIFVYFVVSVSPVVRFAVCILPHCMIWTNVSILHFNHGLEIALTSWVCLENQFVLSSSYIPLRYLSQGCLLMGSDVCCVLWQDGGLFGVCDGRRDGKHSRRSDGEPGGRGWVPRHQSKLQASATSRGREHPTHQLIIFSLLSCPSNLCSSSAASGFVVWSLAIRWEYSLHRVSALPLNSSLAFQTMALNFKTRKKLLNWLFENEQNSFLKVFEFSSRANQMFDGSRIKVVWQPPEMFAAGRTGCFYGTTYW